MTENNNTEEDASLSDMSDDTPQEMTEQIEASFGPMTVYVSGTNSDDVKETFDDVWQQMVDTSDDMREKKREQEDEEGGTTSRTFGD